MWPGDQADTVKVPRVEVASRTSLAVADQDTAPMAAMPQPSRVMRWAPSIAAPLIYLLIAVAYFWWPIRSHFSTMAVNYGIPDLGQNLWYLKWWTYAVSHGLNPFVTYKIYHAYGYNLAWQTSIPGLSFLAAPFTATAGVVAAYNIWTILACTLAAWATFALCYHVTRQFWASLVGGYLFGFSGFMLVQATGHVHLIILFPIPVAVYLTVLRYEKRISRALDLALTPLPFLLLFLVSVEEFTLFAIFAYLALGVFLLFNRQKRRETFWLAVETTGAFVITGLLLLPYLYYMATGYATGEVHPALTFSGDALGFVVPTNVFLLFSKYFASVPLAGGNISERDSYIGLPLALVMIVFAIKYWDKPIHKTLSVMALIAVAFTLGPSIFIAGTPTIPSPMRYVFHLPIIQKSLPIRYAIFVDFAGALMAAIVLAKSVKQWAVKVALGLALTLVLIPNLQLGVFFTPVTVPPFFSTTMYQQYIKPTDNVLILPIGFVRTDMLWQQAADFNFSMPTGYGASIPAAEYASPVYHLFYVTQAETAVSQPGAQAVATHAYVYYLEQYVATEHVTGIVVQERYFPSSRSYLQFLGVTPLHVGGVWYYRVPASFTQATPPAEQVAGEPISRPYSLTGSAQWDDATHQLVAPANTPGVALTTLTDTFAGGMYNMTMTVNSASSTPVARAEVVINGAVTPVSLTNGVTHFGFTIPGKTGALTIRIVSLGGASFTVGDSTMTKV